MFRNINREVEGTRNFLKKLTTVSILAYDFIVTVIGIVCVYRPKTCPKQSPDIYQVCPKGIPNMPQICPKDTPNMS